MVLGQTSRIWKKQNIPLLLVLPLWFPQGSEAHNDLDHPSEHASYLLFPPFLSDILPFKNIFVRSQVLTTKGGLDLLRRNVLNSEHIFTVTKIKTWSIKRKLLKEQSRVTEPTEILTNQLHGHLH